MTTIAQWLTACPLPRAEARMLLRHAAGFSAAETVTRDRESLAPSVLAALEKLAARRLQGEPAAYILGCREFYGRPFAVSPAVLIPRPETELLLEAALGRLPENGSLWDLGTGSGILAVSAKLERPDARIRASDISAEALAVARRNAETLGADIEWALGSWLDAQPLPAPAVKPPPLFDILMANPPYIENGDPHLQQGDLRFEPQAALTDFGDGLSHIRTLAADAPHFLSPRGFLLLEHGFDQGAAVRAIFAERGFREIETLRDLAGHERVSLGRRPAA